MELDEIKNNVFQYKSEQISISAKVHVVVLRSSLSF